MINKDNHKILTTVFIFLIDDLSRSFFSSPDLTQTHLPNEVFPRNARALPFISIFILHSGCYESIYIVISLVTDMPPKKVPKLNNTQSQRKLSSFFKHKHGVHRKDNRSRSCAGNNPGINDANKAPLKVRLVPQ